MSDIFISYSRKDIAIVRLLYESLIKTGMEVWIDWARMPINEKWWDEISEGIKQSSVFIFIISRNSIGEEYCKKEIKLAKERGRRIVPIIVDDTPASAVSNFMADLTAINWIIFKHNDMFRLEGRSDEKSGQEEPVSAIPKEPQFREALEKLNTAIHTDWAWVKMHTRLEIRAEEWEQAARDGSLLLRGKDLRDAENQIAQAAKKKDPKPTDLQQRYIITSRKSENRSRQLTLGILLTGLFILGIVSYFAINQLLTTLQSNVKATNENNLRTTADVQIISQKATAQAESTRTEALRLASEANSQIETAGGSIYGYPEFELSALLSIQSLNRVYNPLADQVLELSLRQLNYVPTIKGGMSSIENVVFSSDGKYVLTSCNDYTAELWDIASGELIRTFFGLSTYSVAISPDAKYVLTGSTDKTVKLWDIASGVLARSFKGSIDRIISVAFSPDGKYVMAGTHNTAILWDIATGLNIHVLGNGRVEFDQLAISPDGKNVISSSGHETIWVSDIASGQVLHVLDAGSQYNNGLVYSPDGRYVLAGSYDGTAKLWDAASGTLIRSFSGHKGIVDSVAFSPDGEYALTGSNDKTVKLWNVATGTEVYTFTGHQSAVNSVAFSPDGKYILTGSEDGTTSLWDIVTEQNIHTFTLRLNLDSLTFSPDGKYVLVSDEDHSVKLFDPLDGNLVRTFIGSTDKVSSIAFSPEGNYIAIGSYDKNVRVYDAQSGQIIHTYTASAGFSSVAFSPDGVYLATLGTDLNILKLATGELFKTIVSDSIGNYFWYRKIQFSPNGKYLLASNQYSADLFDISTGTLLHSFIQKDGDKIDNLSCATFSPNGKFVLTGGESDHIVILWDTSTGKIVHTFNMPAMVSSIAFSPDDKYILIGSDDSTATLWDIQTYTELRSFYLEGMDVAPVVFSPDGKHIMVGGSFLNSLEFWDIDYQDTINRACANLSRDLTQAERKQHGITDKSPTCPNFPAGPETIATTTPAVGASSPKQTTTQILPTLTSNTLSPTLTTSPISPTPLGTATTLDINIKDDFSSDNNGWKVESTDCGVENLSIQNGRMLWNIASKKGCMYQDIPMKMGSVTDFDARVDMQRVTGLIHSDYGIIFRYFDANDYYVFLINDINQTYSVTAYQSYWRALVDWAPASAIHPGKVNHLEISARGSNFTFFINGLNMGTVSDVGISSGKVGLGSWVNNPNPGDKSSFAVDNFELHFNNPK